VRGKQVRGAGPGLNGATVRDAYGICTAYSRSVSGRVDAAEAPKVPMNAQLKVTLAVGMCAVFLAGLDQTIVSTAQPTITGELGGIGKASWIFTSYMLASAIATPVLAKLSDVHSRRLMMQIGIAIFVAGSLACGVAQSMDQLIVARGVQGIGGGGLFPIAMAMIGDLVSPRERGRYVAWLMGSYTAATVMGPTVGGGIVDSVGWRWAFLVNLPLGAIAIVMAQRAPTGTRSNINRRFDIAGLALLATCTTTLLLALQWGGRDHEWSSPVIIGLFAAAVVGGVVMLKWEARTPNAIFPPGLFRSRLFSSTMVISVGSGVMLGPASFLLPIFLQFASGRSATRSGIIMLPVTVGTLIGTTIAGRLIASTGQYRFLARIGFGGGIASLIFFATMGTDVNTGLLAGCMLVYGIAIALCGTVASTVSLSAVGPGELGVANGINLFIRTLSASLSVAVVGALFNSRLGDQLTQRVPSETLATLGDPRALVQTPEDVRALEPAVSHAVIESISRSVTWGFAWILPAALAGLVMALVMRTYPLRGTEIESAPSLQPADE
jgi:EmrB/QacA subfamily drug resistance transporter